MLSLEENRWNLKFMRFLSACNLLPFDFWSGEQIRFKDIEGKRYKLWKFSYFASVVYFFYLVGRLLECVYLKHFRLDHIAVHLMFILGFGVLHTSTFCLIRKNPADVLILYNYLIKGHHNLSCCNPRPARIRGLFQFSLREWVVRVMFIVITGTFLALILILTVDPSRPQLLFSLLPERMQNGYTFMALYLVEVYFVALVVAQAQFIILLQGMFFEKVNQDFEDLQYRLERVTNFTIHWIIKDIKTTQLSIILFNNAFRYIIYAIKCFCFIISISSYFVCVRYIRTDLPLSCFALFIAMDLTLVYNIIFGTAFDIPLKFDHFKISMAVTAAKLRVREEISREIQRIPSLGIRVGDFHQIERMSTPNFVNFVVDKVVALLFAFPRN